MKIINSANIACGYHAGNEITMNETVNLAKFNHVSVGAHPGFNDKINFGRKRINIDKNDLIKIIYEQIKILSNIAEKNEMKISHVKPHGALNNMACENYDLSLIIGKTIKNFDKDLIYMVLPNTEMEKAAKDLNIKYACEIFADRNYNDNGLLISRSKKNAIVTNPDQASNNILKMISDSSIFSINGIKIPCKIDSICVHGDTNNSLQIAKKVKKILINNGYVLKPLNLLKKFNTTQ